MPMSIKDLDTTFSPPSNLVLDVVQSIVIRQEEITTELIQLCLQQLDKKKERFETVLANNETI